jgi:hypothetical protein
MNSISEPPIKKSYPVFDCDAHVTELPEQWNYLSAKEKEEVRPWYLAYGTQRV